MFRLYRELSTHFAIYLNFLQILITANSYSISFHEHLPFSAPFFNNLDKRDLP